MDFQSIEYTKCCHRLYDLLKRSTILDLEGEPWFRVDDSDLYLCSNTTARNVVSIPVFRSDKGKSHSYSAFLSDQTFIPLKDFIQQITNNPKNAYLPAIERNKILCRELSDFFRVHYQKFD